ncbi:unnamed protein product [Amaranthus hypochondriacus]
MVLEKNKKKEGPATNFSQLSIIEKKTPKHLKLKAKKLKQSNKRKLLKSKEAECSTQSQNLNRDKNKTTTRVQNETNHNISENEKAKSSLKGNKKNGNINPQQKKVDAPNPERKVSGLIFMCNAKTKSDCFHYKIMGVPFKQKEVVLSIKPGLKLFLYDFDLKLLYGIFEASSAGGMKLEPPAFGGAFPVQVRFKIFKDCLPLPESVFKNAIKDNYDERTQKFKTELTSKQVKSLKSMFRRVRQPHFENHSGVQQPKLSDALFVTEKEYRSYGLRPQLHGTRQDAVPYAPVLVPESYRTGQEVQGFRSAVQEHIKPAPSHGHFPSLQTQAGSSEPMFLSENEYRMYGLRGRTERSALVPSSTKPPNELDRHRENPYHSHNDLVTTSGPFSSLTAGAGTYEPHSQSTVIEAYRADLRSASYSADYHLPRRVTDEGLYAYASLDLSEHKRSHTSSQFGVAPAPARAPEPAPVSSRYSFAGALYSLR